MASYRELKDKHEKEMNDFSSKYLFFAFNHDRFLQGLEKLGVKEEDAPEKIIQIVSGGFILKENAHLFRELLEKQDREQRAEIAADKTGQGFIKQMFYYELANHEYIIREDITDTLRACGLSADEINQNEALQAGLKTAIKEYKESVY